MREAFLQFFVDALRLQLAVGKGRTMEEIRVERREEGPVTRRRPGDLGVAEGNERGQRMLVRCRRIQRLGNVGEEMDRLQVVDRHRSFDQFEEGVEIRQTEVQFQIEFRKEFADELAWGEEIDLVDDAFVRLVSDHQVTHVGQPQLKPPLKCLQLILVPVEDLLLRTFHFHVTTGPTFLRLLLRLLLLPFLLPLLLVLLFGIVIIVGEVLFRYIRLVGREIFVDLTPETTSEREHYPSQTQSNARE